MTQHIEEARKLASDWALAECDEPCTAAIAAALAAAEERGRIEERGIVEAAKHWSAARGAVHDLSINDPAYRARLNELSEAEDLLSRITKEPIP